MYIQMLNSKSCEVLNSVGYDRFAIDQRGTLKHINVLYLIVISYF